LCVKGFGHSTRNADLSPTRRYGRLRTFMMLIVCFCCVGLLSGNASATQTGESEERTVLASFYGRGDGFHGKRRADGVVFDANDSTVVAHRTLPFGTSILLTNEGGESHCVYVRDRGPWKRGRELDLSYGGAKKLGFVQQGITRLTMRVVDSCTVFNSGRIVPSPPT